MICKPLCQYYSASAVNDDNDLKKPTFLLFIFHIFLDGTVYVTCCPAFYTPHNGKNVNTAIQEHQEKLMWPQNLFCNKSRKINRDS